jgi:CheY-like chemotaxis protein/HPt (histidine-containing phosphotransfer) domain-containing protein
MATTPPAVGKVTIAPTRELALREGRLILVAEDNENNRQVIVRQLALLGYAADVAADGREALALWNSTDYALLVTDLHMPHLDGYELTKAIRAGEAGRARKPIIALTANALKGEDQRCRALGMDDYRSKPAPLSELKAVLEKWMPDATVAGTGPDHSIAAVTVDVDVLRALVGDESLVVAEILDGFRRSAASMAAELRANCTAGRFAAAADTAHKLKPAARAIGAFELAELCAGIESEGRTGNAGAVMALLSRFDAEMAAVNAFLDNQ